MSQLLMKDWGDVFAPQDPRPNKSHIEIPKHNQRFIELKADLTEERTIELSVSSNLPYLRWFGYEELEHTEAAVDLSRFNDGANVLFNHNRDDYIGVVQKAWLDGGKLYNSIRFDEHELAERIYQSIKNGIVRNVSIGYQIDELVMVGQKDNFDVYRATRWTPFETSIVTVPADASVGVGRRLGAMAHGGNPQDRLAPQYFDLTPKDNQQINSTFHIELKNAEEFQKNWEKLEQRITNSVLDAVAHGGLSSNGENPQDRAASLIKNVTQELTMGEEVQGTLLEAISEKDIRQQERDRIAAINAAGSKYGCQEIAQRAVEDGLSIEQTRNLMADKVLTKSQEPVAQPLQPLGFSSKETKRYSIRKAILYKMGQISEREAGLEIEASQAIAQKLGKPAEGIYVPTRDLQWSTRATYAAGASATGGATIETELLAENFIEALRSQLVIKRLGATILSGLEGNVDIPRQASVAGTSWVGEGVAIPQFESTFDKISLTPKTVATRSIYTRNMLLQSSMDIENFIREDLTKGIALEIDRAAISGTGIGGQPLGITNYPGVNAVVIGANGGAPTWQTMVNLETEVALDDALQGTCYYLTNSKVRGKLKTTEKAASTGEFIWQNDRDMGNMGMVNGYGAAVTNQVPGNLTKGTGTNLSIAIFGDFSALIVGEWGILDLLPNPFGTGYEQGNVQVRAMQTVDINSRRPQFFSVCSDVSTL